MALQFSQTIRSLEHDHSRSAYLVWVVAVLFLALWMSWFTLGSVSVVLLSRTARLQAAEAPHEVDASLAGQVVSTHVVIGQSVKKGSVLIELDSSAETLSLREENARVTAIDARMIALQREIDAREAARSGDLLAASAAGQSALYRSHEADVALEFAAGAEQRTSKLSSQGGATKVDALKAAAETRKLTAVRDALAADARRLELEATARGHEAEAEVESLRNTLATLQGEAESARLAMERLKIAIDRHSIRAPVDGRLGNVVPIEVGTYVAEGARVATIIPDGDLIISAEFDPSQTLGRVRPGQHAELRLDGFPWGQFGTIKATVSRISSETSNNTVQSEFRIDNVPDTGIIMEHGLPGSIEVTVEDVSPAELVMRSIGLMISPSGSPALGPTP